MSGIVIKTYPETGRYRLYSNQTGSCTFFDARDVLEAKQYAIGSIGTMGTDKSGHLTDLCTGQSWAIAVEVLLLSADDRANLNIGIRSELDVREVSR